MAAAYTQYLFGDAYEADSAGIAPADRKNLQCNRAPAGAAGAARYAVRIQVLRRRGG